MRRSTEQILTTHTGSLPRPRGLTEELAERDRTGATSDGFTARVRDAVADVVRRQVDAGVAVVNDGEATSGPRGPTAIGGWPRAPGRCATATPTRSAPTSPT